MSHYVIDKPYPEVSGIYYIYTLCYPNGVPFYVGKGQNNRCVSHFWPSSKGENLLKDNIIRKINRSGSEVRINIVLTTVDESLAHSVEEHLIGSYGRRDIRTGILANMTNGGEGVSGKIRTEEEKELRRKKPSPLRGVPLKTETKQKLSKSLKKTYKLKKERGDSIASHLKGKELTEDHKQKISDTIKGRTLSETHVRNQAISKCMKLDDYLLHDGAKWYYIVMVEEFVKDMPEVLKYSTIIRRSIKKKKYSSGIRGYKINKSHRLTDKLWCEIPESVANLILTEEGESM